MGTNLEHIELLFHCILYGGPSFIENQIQGEKKQNTATDFNGVLLICISQVTKLQLFVLME